MSVDYIENEVKNILNEKDFPTNLAMASAWVLGNFKATNLKVLDLTSESALSDYFVLGTATNTVQAQAMAESIVTQLKIMVISRILKKVYQDQIGSSLILEILSFISL